MTQRLTQCLAAFGLLSLAAANACYTYVPVEPSAPAPTGRVRVTLTPDGSQDLTRVLGPGVTVTEGHVGSATEDGTIRMAVDWVQFRNGIRSPWTGEGTVAIPAAYRELTERHVYMRRRSIVASGVLAVGIVATAIIALRTGGAGGDGEGGPPPPPALVPRR